MAKKGFQQHIERRLNKKRMKAAGHEGCHIEIALDNDRSIHIDATIDDKGNGKAKITYPAKASNQSKYRVAVAGLLGEAKLSNPDLSSAKEHVEELAMQIFRFLTGAEQPDDDGAFQVDVHLNKGNPEPAATNLDDFSFTKDVIDNRYESFAASERYNEIIHHLKDAIRDVIKKLRVDAFWNQVRKRAFELYEKGHVKI